LLISKDFANSYLGKSPNWGFNGLGFIVYKRTYARIRDDGLYEEWPETIARCINGAQDIGAEYSREEAERLFDYMFNLKCLFAGRMLWQLGTSNVQKFGGNSLLNCWFTTIKGVEDFCFLFENLMFGGGVGFSVRRQDVHELPKVKEGVDVSHLNVKDADFIVPDSRQGWVKLLRKVLRAYFYTGKSFSYSTMLVRGYGEPLGGFGGVASGPKILVDGIVNICSILKSRENKKLRSVDVLDVCNIIANIVVAGNIRRSAQVALGDPDDFLFIRAKRWDLINIPNWRSLSNNSIYADNFSQISSDIWGGYEGNGEPYGFFNVKLSQKFGRLGELKRDNCEGANPCMELVLADKECCCLSEVALNNVQSLEEFMDCVKLLYKTQKAVCNLDFVSEETTKIVHKNRRIGIGCTGICQSFDKLGWLDPVYKELKEFDKSWSKERNWPESIRLTTIKPSGTLSLLTGSTPGIHPAFSKFFIRRIQMSSDDKLVGVCRELGYKVDFVKNIDGTKKYGTVVVEFPCFSGDTVKIASEMGALSQLDLLKKMQTVWSDNSISITVYFKEDELEDIKKWLDKNYSNSVKSVSFLLHKGHGFEQAPYEEIDEKTYKRMVSELKPVFSSCVTDEKSILMDDCEAGCPVK